MSKSATDELRRMLDERGVEWEDASPVPSMKPWKTSFTSFTGEEVTISAYEEPKWLMGTMVFLTPAQVIAATLGSSNCTNSERMTEQNGPERSGEYVTVWMDHEPTKLHWGVPVVRCRNCEYYRDHEWMMVTDVVDVCHFWADGVKVEPDGFCAWGRLKEEQWASPSSRTQ